MARRYYETVEDDEGNVDEIDRDRGWIPAPGPVPAQPAPQPLPAPQPQRDLVNDFEGTPVVPPHQPTRATGGGGGGSTASTSTAFSYPEFVPPSFDIGPWAPPSWDVVPFAPPDLYPEYAAPDAFNFPAFEGPTAENFQTDPGYEFRAKEMERRVANDASARGLRSSGGYQKDLAAYLGGLASQEFGNVYGRQQGAWRDNRANAMDIYNTNEGNRFKTWEAGRGRNLDELARETARYQANFNDEATEFDRAHLGYQTKYNREADEFNRALQSYGANYGSASGVAGLNLDAELGRGNLELGRSRNDFGNLLSLYDIS